jgi:choline dehydrogenase-like flavoprotein
MPVFETTGWPVPANELQFYYSIAERAMKVTPFYQEGSYFTTILLNRLQEQGYTDAIPMPIAVDLEPTKYGQIHSNAAFSSIVWFAEALNRRPYDLAVNSRAVEIITEKKRVTGVRVMSADKRSHVLKAKTVVLSASTFQSPRLLLASGIPGRAIGHYLTPHSAVVQPRYLEREQFPEVIGALGIMIPAKEDRSYQVSIDGPAVGYNAYQQYQIRPLQEQLEISTSTSGAVESRYDNRVELDPSVRDEYGVPVIRIHFSFSETDQAVIRQMQEGLRQVGSALQAPPAIEGNFGIDRPIIEGNHATGTCRMGIDPDTSATDLYCQIHGISGLYVADNSVMPSSGTANPTLTTVALAIRTADHLIRQLK